jgi:2-amino-4-hydroxy-6-hydroxymethyldihydropteridine diphosphokinase
LSPPAEWPANPASGAERVTAYVALGANLGDAQAAVRQALKDLNALPRTTLLKTSSLYRTAPVDATGPDYVNAVAALSTALTPHALLAALQALEQSAGRERPYHHAPRTLDLDILRYGEQTLNTPDLVIPHPRMGQRAFVLVPLAEIAPETVSPAALAAVADQTITRI